LSRTRYVFNVSRQSFLSLGVAVADTPLARLRGLLGRMRLRPNEGLWVVPSRGIHTFGLRSPIDVIYLDGSQRVLHIIEHLSPLRIAGLRMQSHSVLELPAHAIWGSGTQVGDQLFIARPEEMEAYWNSQAAAAPAAGAKGA
jgi:uncharacterized membrane protein (UPF0127 family)